MIIKRPGSCRCGDPTYTCKIACTCPGPDPDHAPGCHYHLWRDAPGWADSINTAAEELGIELFNIKRETPMTMYKIDCAALNVLRDHCYQTSSKAGWWNLEKSLDFYLPGASAAPLVAQILQLQVGTKFALIHSEISEALEGYRKEKKDDHLPDLPAVDVELADALIRIFDLAGYLGCDLATAVERKMQYNATRVDHKPEARNAPGGKKF